MASQKSWFVGCKYFRKYQLDHLCWTSIFPSRPPQKSLDTSEELRVDVNKWPSSISDVVANYQLLCSSIFYGKFSTSGLVGGIFVVKGLVGWNFQVKTLGMCQTFKSWKSVKPRGNFSSEVVDFWLNVWRFHIGGSAWCSLCFALSTCLQWPEEQACLRGVWRSKHLLPSWQGIWKIRACNWTCANNPQSLPFLNTLKTPDSTGRKSANIAPPKRN